MSSEPKPLTLSFNSARFLQSASKLSNSPAETEIEIAFAGRSNAGKSSAINALCNNKKLARTSKTPGRTQLINFFSLSEPRVRLVDLPGYGYAKVSLDLKEAWGQHLDDYLQNRACLSALVLIMDIRKPLTDFDRMLLDWSHRSQMPTLILLTKADKLKRGAAKQVYFKVVKELEEHDAILSVQLFSSTSKDGVEACRQSIIAFCQSRLIAPE
ncbi:MAG: YihA family ribosome biogenesis GTP-binding protein [Oleiphilus sp.]|nr:MAG: YihA family ribosome biogenesis GTP-binding protein [Oleiphilus sp.]